MDIYNQKSIWDKKNKNKIMIKMWKIKKIRK